MKRAVSTAALTAVLLSVSFPASAQAPTTGVPCSERENIVAKLEAQFAERQTGIGLTAQGRLIEIFAADDGTWTMLLTTAENVSCVVNHGVNWYERSTEDKTGTPSSGTAPSKGLTNWRNASLPFAK